MWIEYIVRTESLTIGHRCINIQCKFTKLVKYWSMSTYLFCISGKQYALTGGAIPCSWEPYATEYLERNRQWEEHCTSHCCKSKEPWCSQSNQYWPYIIIIHIRGDFMFVFLTFSILQTLTEHNTSCLEEKNSDGLTPFHIAIRQGKLAWVQ